MGTYPIPPSFSPSPPCEKARARDRSTPPSTKAAPLSLSAHKAKASGPGGGRESRRGGQQVCSGPHNVLFPKERPRIPAAAGAG